MRCPSRVTCGLIKTGTPEGLVAKSGFRWIMSSTVSKRCAAITLTQYVTLYAT